MCSNMAPDKEGKINDMKITPGYAICQSSSGFQATNFRIKQNSKIKLQNFSFNSCD